MPEPDDDRRLGELLVSTGKVSREEFAAALDAQRKRGGSEHVGLGELLVERGVLSAADLDRTQIATAPEQTNVPGGAPPASSPGGQRVGRFEICEVIGRGGMGAVFRARDPQLQRDVAIKLISVDGAQGQSEHHVRFLREAEVTARLRHPGIVTIHEVGIHGLQPFIVMDLVQGTSLAELLGRDPPPSTRQLVEWIRQVADALQHAHEQGVIHRDIKPANILIQEAGQSLLVDFGVARDLEASRSLTATGEIVGTVYYLAPEQAGSRGGEVGPQTDVFALGATLYRALAGRPPFHADNAVAVIKRILMDDPPVLSQLNPDVSLDLQAIVQRCLEKDPRRRYPSAAALSKDLRRFLASEPLDLSSPGLVGRLSRGWQRWSSQLALGGLVAGALVAAAVALRGGDGSRVRSSSPSPVATKRVVSTQPSDRKPDAVQVEQDLLAGVWWDPPADQLDYAQQVEMPLVLEISPDLKLVLIPSGQFPRAGNSGTRYRVAISKGFYVAATEVTNAQFRQQNQQPGNPLMGVGDEPVGGVSWTAARAYCQWLSSQDSFGLRYRLPTEAEWEHACRAGVDARYYWGDDPAGAAKHENVLDRLSTVIPLGKSIQLYEKFAHVDDYRHSAPVGSYLPNPWGLFDMLGNVREWCSDYAGLFSEESVTDPKGPKLGKKRIYRGGSWDSGPRSSQSGWRSSDGQGALDIARGFRVVADLPSTRDR